MTQPYANVSMLTSSQGQNLLLVKLKLGWHQHGVSSVMALFLASWFTSWFTSWLCPPAGPAHRFAQPIDLFYILAQGKFYHHETSGLVTVQGVLSWHFILNVGLWGKCDISSFNTVRGHCVKLEVRLSYISTISGVNQRNYHEWIKTPISNNKKNSTEVSDTVSGLPAQNKYEAELSLTLILTKRFKCILITLLSDTSSLELIHVITPADFWKLFTPWL